VYDDANVLRPVIDWALRAPDRPVAAYREGSRFIDVSAAEFYERVRALARGLIASGVKPGDRVVLMSSTRLEWTLVDDAILAAGAVTVPVYETSSAEQLQWILSDSGAVMAVVETEAMRALLAEVPETIPDCREMLAMDSGELAELARRGKAIDDSLLDTRIEAVRGDDLATIVYTSGTTGRPKGCVLTHGNLRTNTLQNLDAVRDMLEPHEDLLLFLPLAHTLSKIIALVCTEWGARISYATDLGRLPEELGMTRPTLVAAVPRVFEKVFNSAQAKARAEGHGAIFDHAAEIAVRWSKEGTAGHHGPLVTAEHVAFDRAVYRKIHAAFGGRLRFAFSGGGPLGERLTHFFNGVGVRIFEGYGLTETSPTLTLNAVGAWRPGTVGRPLEDTSIRIAPDGEILAKGPQVFGGYWHNPEATAEVFDGEGWFKTGDIGELDPDGYLRITGRKKELIVTAAGKNVAPAPLEDRIRAHWLVSQAVVVGDGRPFIGALVTIDEDAAGDWAVERGLLVTGSGELLALAELRAAVQQAIDDANRSVSRAESIREFAILPQDLTIAAGELTPTLKVRRFVVEKAYAPVIEQLYGG
jgi:long-chain acyl-CoA synthetase